MIQKIKNVIKTVAGRVIGWVVNRALDQIEARLPQLVDRLIDRVEARLPGLVDQTIDRAEDRTGLPLDRTNRAPWVDAILAGLRGG